ncbi:DUF1905 domain-containing protein [Glycomyces sp. A-F 0318]|uniref:DUF1905 domain-containing protein n=1 Tax=Glycomyces amatae TaxID=2881355 RepID=UPI001E3F97E4|nr:DUF1905 domain-containing protein [Glycomyces amatae]MCD0442570.1 DUF1905 domain-containing protein [Glycomyces amatae]
MELEFSGEVWYWRGPAPWYFVTVPEAGCRELAAASGVVSYGWGMIPANVRIGQIAWSTSLWPKDGAYIVPLKSDVRRKAGVDDGDAVTVRLTVDL